MGRIWSRRVERADELAQLRRAVAMVTDRGRREAMLTLIDQMVDDAGWNGLDQIRATEELRSVRGTVAALRDENAALALGHELLLTELGEARRQRDAHAAELIELRSMAGASLADELVEIAIVVERERPNEPPPIPLRQAARVVRAVRNTARSV